MKKGFLLIIFIFLGVYSFSAVGPPDLKCVSVDEQGNTTLTWIPPVDPLNEFVEYNVFVAAVKTGPYTMNVVNGIATNTFLDNINDASLGDFYYFVQTVYDPGTGVVSSASSDTGRSILPIFGVVTDSTANIEWDPIFDPNIGTNSGMYNISRKISSLGTYVNVGTANFGNENFFDVFKVCYDTLFYKIEISDATGCVSSSAILSALFQDITSPATPVYDSITVFDNNGVQQVQMGWKPSSSPDTRGYNILYWTKAPPAYSIRATLLGVNTTSFTENLAAINPGLDWEMYTINAFDSCSAPNNPNTNTSPGADDQRTIHLSILPNNCENTISLNWTPYINWADIDAYEILVSVNNGPYQVEFTVPSVDTSFVYTKTDALALFCYKIRAVSVGRTRTSSSNFECALANSAIVPKKQYFKQVTVENNKDIHVVSLTDTTLPASNYILFRSLEPVENFFEVDRIPFDNSSIIRFDDFNASVDQTSYFYRIGVEDTCGSLLFITRPASSVLLKGVFDEDSLNVFLNWNEYKGWDTVFSGVQEYAINLYTDGVKKQVGTVASGVTNFAYPLENEITFGANFCFEIEAREGDGNPFNQKDTVLSNQVCFTDNLKLFVPNAFRPGGANPVFYPVFSYGDVSSYRMIIYDRWGGIVFETTDFDQGWDGMVEGEISPFGTYLYQIELGNFTGAHYKKSGTFILLR